MTTFKLEAIVRRHLTDIVAIHVDAETEAKAVEKAEEVLLRFPEPHTIEGVPYCYVDSRSVDGISIRRIKVQEDIPEGEGVA